MKVDNTMYDLAKQNSICHMFLNYLGCNVKEIEYLEENSIQMDSDLFSSIGNFSNIKRVCSTSEEANKVMDCLVECMLELLKDRVPISDDMLNLCYHYCKMRDIKINNKFDNDFPLMRRFVNLLHNTVETAFDYKSETKPRDHAWFKNFLLNSNIFFHSMPSNYANSYETKIDEIKEDEANDVDINADDVDVLTVAANKMNKSGGGGSNALIFTELEKTVDKQLMHQKKFIVESIIKEVNTEKDAWNAVVNFEELNVVDQLRQDKILNGIKSDTDFSDNEFWQAYSRTQDKNFDCFEEYNIKNHLCTLLILAHHLNPTYQMDMRRIWSDINKHALFQSAPVKLEERCIVKCQTDVSYKIVLF